MKQQTVKVTQTFNSPVEQVFAKLADHNQLSSILIIPIKRIKDGTEDANGVGSVRRMGPWPFGTHETVVGLTPNEQIDYRITKFGGPIINHEGKISFENTGNSTVVTWEIEFDAFPKFVGGGIAGVLQVALSRGLKKAANQLSR